MPGYDGTGPQRSGPNGRGLGPCGQGRTSNRLSLFGFRRGWRGMGRGFRWFNRFPSDEKEDLESTKAWLSEQLNAVNQRIDKLQKEE